MGELMAYREPRRADVHCRTCLAEIEAIGEYVGAGFGIQGLRAYAWRHVITGSSTCTTVSTAAPFNAWAATRQLAAALRAETGPEG